MSRDCLDNVSVVNRGYILRIYKCAVFAARFVRPKSPDRLCTKNLRKDTKKNPFLQGLVDNFNKNLVYLQKM